MIEAEWWEYDAADELAAAVASDIGFIIGQAIAARGDAVVALPGGRSPAPIFERLARAKLNWRRVTIVPGDDRLVDVTDPLSNAAALARHFLPLGARVVPLVSASVSDHRAAGAAADARLADLHWPLDLVWLGVGADGHTASIFPGPDLEAALNAPTGRRAVGVMPDPLPPDAPVGRVTLTRGAIAAARTLLLTLSGDAKRAVLEQAIAEGDSSRYPVGRVLEAADKPVDIHWCPA
jgi:6-phosphogluconolactonase